MEEISIPQKLTCLDCDEELIIEDETDKEIIICTNCGKEMDLEKRILTQEIFERQPG